MLNLSKIAILFTTTSILTSCSRQEIDPAPQSYTLPVPAHFPQPVYDTENPMTREGIALGRLLFYDIRLSGNNKISCATCHDQSLAFSDGKALTASGVSGTPLLRHSPTLINMAWANNGLFWDGGSTNLESQAFAPLTATDEMAQNLDELVQELKAIPDYVSRFQLVFKDEIRANHVVKALAQFQRTLISADSRYDRYKSNSGGTLSEMEQKGLSLVATKCQGCHTGELFTDNRYHNNGLDANFTNNEHEGIFLGRYRISYQDLDIGSFKTPTLRNVAVTAPYMHDGRFATLEEVLEHYATGIQPSPSLDSQIPTGGMNLTKDEKEAILAFLYTLTDHNYLTNANFGTPFK